MARFQPKSVAWSDRNSHYAALQYNTGKIDSCKYYLYKALHYFKDKDTPNGRTAYSEILNNLSFIYSTEGKTDSSLFYHDKVLELALKDSLTDVAVSTLLSKTHLLSKYDNNYGAAIETVEKAIKIAVEAKDSVNLISCLQAYGDLYVNCHFFEEAAAQYQEVLKYKNHFKPYSLFCYYNGKGRMFYLQKKYDEAKSEFLNARAQWNSIDKVDKIIVSSNLAEVYLYCQQPDSAKIHLDYLTSEYESFKNIPDFKFNYYSLLGEYFDANGNVEKASGAFSAADAIRSETNLDFVIEKLHLQRTAAFYSSIGLFKKAYLELEVFNELNERILEGNNRKQVSALKYRFQRDTTLLRQKETIFIKEQEVEQLALRQKFLLVIAGLGFLLLVAIVLWWRNSELKKQEIQSLTHARDIAVLRMENARNRISPHFMFNVLNAVMDNKRPPLDKEQNLKVFTRLLQANLANVDSIGIPLKDELRFVRDFVMLDNLRFETEIEYKEEIDEGIDANMLIPSMCVHILAENAIKHGLRPKAGHRELHIKAERYKREVLISVIDNGVGRGAGSASGTGTGLKVLRQFISIINRNNLKKISFEYVDLKDSQGSPAGTIGKLFIPQDIVYEI